MELHVNVTRDGEAWGFEFVGGADCGIPLTIVKVQPPAQKAGLQDGDKVLRINNTVVSDLTYDEARKFVADCGDSLSFGVSRGLYDPVLDDQEPLYDYGPDDFDQPSSEPTEEEIREIERKSSLLASAIDETIKSIEEYKEEVAMEMNKEIKKKEVMKTEHSSTKYEQRISASSKSSIMNGTNGTVHENNEVYENNGDMKYHDTVIEMKSELDTAESENDNNTKAYKNNTVPSYENGHNGEADMNITNAEFNTASRTSIRVMNMKSDGDTSNEELATDKRNVAEIKDLEAFLMNGEKSKSFEEDINSKQYIETVTKNEKLNDINEYKPSMDKKHVKVESILKLVENGSSRITEDVVESKIVEEKPESVEKSDPLLGFRPVHFDPEAIQEKWSQNYNYMQNPVQIQGEQQKVYMTEKGEMIGTIQGIVDGLEEAVVDEEVAKELGKPGITEEKIAELISGESEMLREAHVMGLARVLSTHMHRADDSSVDFKKIKPIVESLNNSEVLKALNEEIVRTLEEKKKEEQKKWTTFLQKPKRPVPRAKFGYPGYVEPEEVVPDEPYKVKIVKQPKPKVAPDYKPEDFDTGPLPWEQRAEEEASLPPAEPEEPILIPEEVPEFLEAVDPLPESEVPDLEDTGIPLPEFETIPLEEAPQEYISEDIEEEQKEEEFDLEEAVEETVQKEEEMEQNTVIDQLLRSVQSLVDPGAPLDQQLQQMRGQLAALAQLPEVIQQTLDLVTRQFNQISQQESQRVLESQNVEVQNNEVQESQEVPEPPNVEAQVIEEVPEQERNGEVQYIMTEEEMDMRRREEEEIMKSEKQKKIMMEQAKQESESRQVKQRPTPRVGKPKRMFGPLSPEERAIVLPGGRRWRGPNDAYNEQFINETLTSQAELIQGRVLGPPYESEILPYDHRINFMKYEKPPVTLDHLQNSEVYKLIHDMDGMPPRSVEMRTPVICEADYRERVRSQTPSLNIPQQLHP